MGGGHYYNKIKIKIYYYKGKWNYSNLEDNCPLLLVR